RLAAENRIGLHGDRGGLRAAARRHGHAICPGNGAGTGERAERVFLFFRTRGTLEAEPRWGRVAQVPDVAIDSLFARPARIDQHGVAATAHDRHDHPRSAGALTAPLLDGTG